jgi:hypothetical protein
MKFLRAWAAFWLVVAVAWSRPFTVVAYNVENLVDADGKAGFDDYKPPAYTPRHTLTKVQNVARVLARFDEGHGPDIILFEEIEVDETPSATPPDYDAILQKYAGMKIEEMLGAKLTPEIADLPAEALLAKAMADRGLTGYHVVAADNVQVSRAGEPPRSLSQKCVVFTRFPVKAVHSHPTVDARAILEVQVEIDGAKLYLFANHWKSGASDPATEATRVANARTLRTRLDEILKEDPNADVILGGDFNSQYNQRARYGKTMKETGLNDVLGSQGNELAVRSPTRPLYNLWYELPPAERGSDTYRGEWGTLMQLMVTRGLYDFRGVQYVDNSFGVAKFAGLNADAMGLPVRWSGEGPTGSGFSDHFPVYAKFITVNDGRTDRYLALQHPSEERPESAEAEVLKIGYADLDLAKVALTAEKIPAGANLRDGSFTGKIFRVTGPSVPGQYAKVTFAGEDYEVYSPIKEVRDLINAEREGPSQSLSFYGELGQFKGRWQFVVQDAAWVK